MRDRSQDLLYALLLVGGVALGVTVAEFGAPALIIIGSVCAIALGAVGIARLADILAGDDEEPR